MLMAADLSEAAVTEGAQALARGDKIDLHVVKGVGEKQVLGLKPGSVIQIGRHASNDIVLEIPGVSQRHAELYMSQKPDGTHQLVLRDKSSRNGIGLRQKQPESGGGPTTWDKLPSGGMKVFGHGGQVKVPLRSLTKKTASQRPEIDRLLTFYITNTANPEPKPPPKPPPQVYAPQTYSPAKPAYHQQFARKPLPNPAAESAASAAAAAAQAAAVAAAQAAAAKLKLKKPPEGATQAEIEEFERKRKEKKEKKAKKKAALLGTADAAAAAAAAAGGQGGRWRKGKTAGEVPRTAAGVNAAIDAELGLQLAGEGDGPTPGATRPKRKAKPGAPARELHQWEVVGEPAVFVRSHKNLDSATYGTKPSGMIVMGYKEGDWVALQDEPGYMMISHPDMGFLMKDMGIVQPAVLGSSDDEDVPAKSAAETHWRQQQGAGIRLTEQSLRVVSSAAQAAHEKRRSSGQGLPGDFDRGRSMVVAQSIIRDMSVSPISQPGVGRKKKKKPVAAPETSEDSDDGQKAKKRKRKDALLAQQLQARAGGSSLRQVAASSPTAKRRKTDAAGKTGKTKDADKKKAKKAEKSRK